MRQKIQCTLLNRTMSSVQRAVAFVALFLYSFLRLRLNWWLLINPSRLRDIFPMQSVFPDAVMAKLDRYQVLVEVQSLVSSGRKLWKRSVRIAASRVLADVYLHWRSEAVTLPAGSRGLGICFLGFPANFKNCSA